LSYQNLYDFTRETRFPLSKVEKGLSTKENISFQQKGKLAPLGLAYSLEVTPRLSLGVTLNLWNDDWFKNGWEKSTIQEGTGLFVGNPFSFEQTSFDRFTFRGCNANVGLLWRLNGKWTFGAVLKTPFTADLKHESQIRYAHRFPLMPSLDAAGEISLIGEERLGMPMSYGIGGAYRSSDAITVSLDLYRTEWGDFVRTDAQGNAFSLVSGRPIAESGIDPTHQVRLGAEYLFIKPGYAVPLRAGAFYDPTPAEGGSDTYCGVSLGLGLVKGPFILDMAYQYRFGNKVGSHLAQNMGFSQNVQEHTVYTSLIIHF
jgi:long-subunit fatty acid transport protein